jgi:hypothetical protein
MSPDTEKAKKSKKSKSKTAFKDHQDADSPRERKSKEQSQINEVGTDRKKKKNKKKSKAMAIGTDNQTETKVENKLNNNEASVEPLADEDNRVGPDEHFKLQSAIGSVALDAKLLKEKKRKEKKVKRFDEDQQPVPFPIQPDIGQVILQPTVSNPSSSPDSQKIKKGKKRKLEEVVDSAVSLEPTTAVTITSPDPTNFTLKFDPPDLPTLHPPILAFSALQPLIDEKLYGKVRALGFDQPTSVQSYVWKPILDGKDLIGVSKTG